MFNGIVIEKDEQGYTAQVKEIDDNDLPEGDVTIKVSHSTLNYKDALAITGKGPVVRKFPMVPGIDLVGTVEQSDSERFAIGDTVLLNGFGGVLMEWDLRVVSSQELLLQLFKN